MNWRHTKMSKYEVQEYTLFNGWINNWYEYDDDNNETKMTFNTKKEAKLELKSYLLEMEKAYLQGDIETPEEGTYFRIMEVKE